MMHQNKINHAVINQSRVDGSVASIFDTAWYFVSPICLKKNICNVFE